MYYVYVCLIHPAVLEGIFVLDPFTGVITILGELDYELHQQYHLTIEAIDNGITKRTDNLDLYVYLTDVNDNSPEFVGSYGPYT